MYADFTSPKIDVMNFEQDVMCFSYGLANLTADEVTVVCASGIFVPPPTLVLRRASTCSEGAHK